MKTARSNKGPPSIYAPNTVRPDLAGTTANASDSSQEEIMGLKHSEAAIYGIRDDDILKTTDISVSVDDSDRAASRAQSVRAW